MYSPRNLSHQVEKKKYQKEVKIENSGTVPAVTNKAPCFTQLNRDCHWLILGHVVLTKLKCIVIVIYLAMYPARATLQHVIKAWWKVA